MSSLSRSLKELEAAKPRMHPHENELVVHVTCEEALCLHKAGATVFSGCSRVDACNECQRYIWNGKTYLWVARNKEEKFPIPSEYGEMLHNLALNATD